MCFPSMSLSNFRETKGPRSHSAIGTKYEGPDTNVGPIQPGGGTEFFEVRDPEGNSIEICKEP